MQNLLRFLYTYSHFIFFLVLELIALVALVEFNHYHQSFFFTSANRVTGTIYTWRSNAETYLNLREKNEELLQENLKLRERDSLMNMHAINRDSSEVRDTARRLLYSYRTAHVINNSVNKRRNYFTIDKGSEQGIRRDMGVITPSGIAGKIVKVSRNFAVGMSVLHDQFIITPQINQINIYSGLYWPGNSSSELKIDRVNAHFKISEGDSVFTTGHSHYFPPGVLIGRVSRVKGLDANYQEVMVRLSNNIGQIRQVYVVQNMSVGELDSLEGGLEDERR